MILGVFSNLSNSIILGRVTRVFSCPSWQMTSDTLNLAGNFQGRKMRNVSLLSKVYGSVKTA